MAKRLTREELHALVWDKPVTRLAKEFGLSDVALHKICRKHNIPTPPLGYWAKKAHGKPVSHTPLPRDGSSGTIFIREGAEIFESEAVSAARARVQELAERLSETPAEIKEPILERTLTQLARAKPDRTGIAKVDGKGLISVAVRPESAQKAERLLKLLVGAARAAGLTLEAAKEAAAWHVDGETVTFEVVEAVDRIEHVPSEAELAALAKWEAKREDHRKRYGYASDWGRPHIPKWEERFQGRLSIRLEEVRIRTENEYWGPVIRRVFADSKTRDVAKAIPTILSTIAAIAVAKRENRAADERRRLAREEAERRRVEAERRAEIERKRRAILDKLMSEHEQIVRFKGYLAALEGSLKGDETPERVARLIMWIRERLEKLRQASAPDSLDARLAHEGVFELD
jgi:hypothetical protein